MYLVDSVVVYYNRLLHTNSLEYASSNSRSGCCCC